MQRLPGHQGMLWMPGAHDPPKQAIGRDITVDALCGVWWIL